MSPSVIEVQALEIVRGGRQVIRGMTFSVPAGKVTGLLGPSGSGKTTLMRAIVGIQKVANGEVHVLGELAGTPRLRRLVGYVTQAPSVYDDLTVEENLRYFARVLDAPAGSVGQAIETVGLSGHERQQVGTLSGGEQARVSLATALLAGPPVLVLDEPTVGLDPVLRRDLWNTFHRLASEGTTLLVSSHVMDEAERCDGLLLLRDGKLLAEETPQGLRARTASSTMDEAFLRLIEGEQAD